MCNVLYGEIGLSPTTVSSFYHHQKSPQRTSLDKIEAWIEKKKIIPVTIEEIYFWVAVDVEIIRDDINLKITITIMMILVSICEPKE